MLHSRAQTTPLFRTSLRDWQANFKAKQGDSAERVETPPTLITPSGQPRVKRLAARKKRKMRQASSNNQR